MLAVHPVVTLGLFHMRRLQIWFTCLKVDTVHYKERMLSISLSVKGDLDHWRYPQTLERGVPMGTVKSYVTVFMDAFLMGWDRTCQTYSVGCWWPESLTSHINILEFSTVLRILKHFYRLVKGQHILV